MSVTLDKINLEEQVIIKRVKGPVEIRRRLLDLGFIPGAKSECILISPFKDPKAYRINGNIIAIRLEDAKNVEVDYAKY